MKVLIVGGDPVGLKNVNRIDILEKRSEYTRDQIVALNSHVFELLPRGVREKIWGKKGTGCFIDPPGNNQFAYCHHEYSQELDTSMLLKDLENALCDHVKTINKICIIIRTADRHALDKASTMYSHIIACDGRNSTVRSWAGIGFPCHFQAYGVGFTYQIDDVKIQTRPRRTDTINKHIQNRFRGFRSRSGSFYLGVQLTYDEYRRLEGCVTLDDANDSGKHIFRQAAHYYRFETPADPSKVNVITFPVQYNVASQSRKRINKAIVVLVGDAYQTAHYFSAKGVNNGLSAVRVLVTGDTNKMYSDNEIRRLRSLDPDTFKECKNCHVFPMSVYIYSRWLSRESRLNTQYDFQSSMLNDDIVIEKGDLDKKKGDTEGAHPNGWCVGRDDHSGASSDPHVSHHGA